MTNPYQHPIATPIRELQGVASIASDEAERILSSVCADREDGLVPKSAALAAIRYALYSAK